MFYTKVNKRSNKEMYNFLVNHFMYDTMNPWNGLKSIANNVKLYNLDLKNNYWDVYDMLTEDDWRSVNTILEGWEDAHPGYQLGFNGKSGGYLVIYNKGDRRNIIPSTIFNTENYDDFKSNLKSWNYPLSAYARETLIPLTELVQSFDKLCDDLVKFIDKMTDEYLKEKKEDK